MNPIQIMVNGLPGRMAQAVVKAALEQPGVFQVVPKSLCGPEIEQETCQIDRLSFQMIGPNRRETWPERAANEPRPIAIDFTVPGAVEGNTDLYCRAGMPFVLGTTSGDYRAVEQRVARSEICAVAAPNMSAPILLVQAAFEYLASRFPDALQGWSAEIIESHQAGKRDTSGTARKMVEYLKALGTDADVDRIEKVRDPEVQRSRMNVPEDFLSGHAYHTYTLRSPERSVELCLSHNVLGRATYAAGTLAAVRFLATKQAEGIRGKTYTMLDVLRATGE